VKFSFFKKLSGIFIPYNFIKTPIILQLSETECGVAALAIMLSYYKTNVPIEKLREMCGTSRDGCKATTLINAATELGYDADAYRVEVNELLSMRQPVIAFWNFNHYVIINGFGTNKVFINDPASGPSTISMNEFDAAFTGIIIVLSPTKNTIPIKPVSVFLPLIKEWIAKFYPEFTFILACLFIALICPLLNSILAKIFVDYCVTSANAEWIPYLGLLGIVFSVIFCVANTQQKWSEFKLCAKASIIKTSTLAVRMFRLPMIFYSLRQKSEVISLLSRAEMIVSQLFKSLTKFIINLATILVCLFFMKKINSSLFIASLILSSLSCYCFYGISKLNLSVEKLNINATGKYYAYATTSMRNIETVKACGLERNVLEKWRNLFARKISIQDKSSTFSLMLESYSKFFEYISMITLFMLGGIQMAQGYISIGYLMAYYSLHLFYYGSLTGFLLALKDSQTAYVSHVRVNNIFCYEEDNRFKNNNSTPPEKTGHPLIICENVDFYYNKTTPAILHKINLEIKPLQHIAFVGSTGSGKSTLAKLLCALFQAQAGKIIIYGKDITKLSQQDIANLFAYVAQDISLFSGTLYDNLTLWKQGISSDEINAAIQTACLEEVITKRSLTGTVAENGNNFSGGERQRMDIARALIQNTQVLVLDEATSALDNLTEMKLLANLRKLHKTVIYVAHRLSTIQHCDQIFVMNNGLIVENGNHHELLQKKSHYYQLVQNEHGMHSA
jgi:ATP-binding cassette subfamily C protein